MIHVSIYGYTAFLIVHISARQQLDEAVTEPFLEMGSFLSL